MKKAIYLFLGLVFILSSNVVAQATYDDNTPYLDDDDIAAIEIFLPEDTPEGQGALVAEGSPDATSNEMRRLNTSQTLYHLLVLDRMRNPSSDISGTENMQVLYKYRHGRNGYIIAVYASSTQGPVFPIMPANSRILVDMVTTRKATLREYVNSTAFEKFVTNRRIISAIQRALR